MGDSERVNQIIYDENREDEGWLIEHFTRERAKTQQQKSPSPFSFDDLTEDGRSANTLILAAAAGDIRKYYWIIENLTWPQLFEYYYENLAWVWKPEEKNKNHP